MCRPYRDNNSESKNRIKRTFFPSYCKIWRPGTFKWAWAQRCYLRWQKEIILLRMTFRDSLDSCSYCSHVVNRGTEAAFVDLHNEIIEEWRLQKESRPRNPQSIICWAWYWNRSAYKCLFSSTVPCRFRHRFAHLLQHLLAACGIGLFVTLQDLVSSLIWQVTFWFLSCSDFVLCFSLQVVFNFNFVLPVAIMLESYKNMSIYQLAALFLNNFLYETMRFAIKNLCRSTLLERNRYAKRFLWTIYM